MKEGAQCPRRSWPEYSWTGIVDVGLYTNDASDKLIAAISEILPAHANAGPLVRNGANTTRTLSNGISRRPTWPPLEPAEKRGDPWSQKSSSPIVALAAEKGELFDRLAEQRPDDEALFAHRSIPWQPVAVEESPAATVQAPTLLLLIVLAIADPSLGGSRAGGVAKVVGSRPAAGSRRRA